MPPAIKSWRLRFGSAHCDRELGPAERTGQNAAAEDMKMNMAQTVVCPHMNAKDLLCDQVNDHLYFIATKLTRLLHKYVPN